MIFVCKQVNVYNYQFHYHYQNGHKKVGIIQDQAHPSKNKLKVYSRNQPIQLLAHKKHKHIIENNIQKKGYLRTQSEQKKPNCLNSMSQKTMKNQIIHQQKNYQFYQNPTKLKKEHEYQTSLQTTINLTKKYKANNNFQTYYSSNVEKYNPMQISQKLKLGSFTELKKSYYQQSPQQKQNQQTYLFTKEPQILINKVVANQKKNFQQRLSQIKRETVISQQIREDQSRVNQYIFDESTIIEHNIQGKFIKIVSQSCPNIQLSQENYLYIQYNAIECFNGILVSIKQIISNNDQTERKFNQQVKNYRRISSHPSIMELYRIYMHKDHKIIVKQPYSSIIKLDFDQSQDVLRKNLKQIEKGLEFLEAHDIYLDWLNPVDIKIVCGTWKLANLSKSVDKSSRIDISTNIMNLKNKLLC